MDDRFAGVPFFRFEQNGFGCGEGVGPAGGIRPRDPDTRIVAAAFDEVGREVARTAGQSDCSCRTASRTAMTAVESAKGLGIWASSASASAIMPRAR